MPFARGLCIGQDKLFKINILGIKLEKYTCTMIFLRCRNAYIWNRKIVDTVELQWLEH